MTPLRFGLSDRDMLGILTSPVSGGGDLAVLFCNPFGQEAVRSKPMYRAFAERLMRQGVHALRFDYHGTGDSPGEGEQQGLSDWIRDARVALDVLLRATCAKRLHVFGIGLGATIAALMSAEIDPVPQRVALWQPVTDGKAYIERMQAVHRQELSRNFGEPWPVVRDILRTTEPQAPGFLLGFPVGQRLYDELTTLGGLSLQALAKRGCRIECATAPTETARAEIHERIRWHASQNELNWMSQEVFRGAIVSTEVQSFLFDGVDSHD